MKKYIILLAAFACTFSSCDDYLDKLPENELNVVDVDYSNLSDMFNPVSGTYATIRTGRGFGSWSGFGLIAVRGDDVEKGSTPTDQIEYQYCKNFEYFRINEFWALNATWGNLYYSVQAANGALEALGKYREHATSSDALALNTQYQAEVRFLRAYTLFYIARLWGDAPLLTSNDMVLEALGKTPHGEILAFVNEEMDFCIANLPALRPNEMSHRGQATKYSALALKAKIQSDRNEWDSVLAATNEVIESGRFSLYPDFYQAFKKPGRLSDESLFELQYSDFGSATAEAVTSDAWFAFQGPRGSIRGVKPMASGWGFMTPSQSLVNLMERRGETVRKTTTLLFTDAVTPDNDTIPAGSPTEPTVYNGKVYLPSVQLTDGRTDYGIGNNIRMLRYADVLLLNAEARVRLGQNGDAPLNEVRARAEQSAITGATLEQVLEERRIELACEWGERFFDLVRTGLAESTLPGFVKGQSEFYPIPQAELDINPLLR
jgi:SusD family.